MTENVSAAVAEVAALFTDTRLQHCQLKADADDRACKLSGAVLDEATLQRVEQELSERLPGVTVDLSNIDVLRPTSRFAAVGANLTGLYARPSFLAEQISQLLNGWPVEVLKEEGLWRFVRQMDGYLGWAYGPYLADAISCTFTHLICAPEAILRTEPDEGAEVSTRLLGGTAVAVDASERGWCHVALAGVHSGWLPSGSLRSFDALPETAEARRSQMIEDAMRLIGVQYLWGGCSAWGIDCSGFAQLIHRLSGMTLPRDADMQYTAGRPVEFPYRPGDLLFFGEGDEPRKITHVAISLGGWDIIHSSRRINGVYPDDVEAVQGLRDTFVAARTFIG